MTTSSLITRCTSAATLGVLSTLLVQTVSAQEFVMPPNPAAIRVAQPDGLEVVLRLRGAGTQHWYEDMAGHPVVRTGDRYHYARQDASGRLIATQYLVGVDDPESLAIPTSVSPAPSAQDALTSAKGAEAHGAGTPGFTQSTGTVENLVLLARFADHGTRLQDRALPTADELTIVFNQEGGDPRLAPTGSLRDHFLETSYGKLTIDSTVYAWIDLPQTEAHYAAGASGLGEGSAELVADVLSIADERLDFSRFDADGDGRVDALTILHSGYGAEWGGLDAYGASHEDRIWSHKWTLPTWSSDEGPTVSDYILASALWGTQGEAPVRIGVLAHETGHLLGLPDQYDVDGTSAGAGVWSLMSGGSWGLDGSQLHPTHMGPWSKLKLGWLEAVRIQPGRHELPRVEDEATVFIVDNGYAEGEYLLIENRGAVGFDAQLPGEGLAIWHVDETQGSVGANRINSEEGEPGQADWPQNGRHFRVSLVQADGNFDLERDVNRGDAGDLYHAGGVSSMSGAAADGYQRGRVSESQNEIVDISSAGGSMTFTYRNPATPRVTTTVLPDGHVGTRYSHQLTSEGGDEPLVWSEQIDAPSYQLERQERSRLADRGQARNWNADDGIWQLELPFQFPYFDGSYDRVFVSSNGFVEFAETGSEPIDSTQTLRASRRIAPFWEDLRTDGGGNQDIYVDTRVEGEVAIRWVAETFSDASPVEFAVVLFEDGRIRFDYGELTGTQQATAGISRGEAGHFHAPELDGGSLLFTLEGSQLPEGLELTPDGEIRGIPLQPGPWSAKVRVTGAQNHYGFGQITGILAGFVDCNNNGIDDATDISNGTSQDCDSNGVPDECQLVNNDCNSNGIPDNCETDCNSNGTPDECESFTDCNSNSIPDECELVGNDCNSNGIPDECETDCNNNGTPDDCESFTDCNSNSIPDECELTGNDCNSNSIPDDCETDCNNNGTPDDCESFTDCNSNSIPDECELAGNDCNTDGIPDDCQLAGNDCNSNSIPDECDTDCNANNIPDDCESFTDCNSNGIPDECDTDCNNNGTPDDCETPTDCNSNGIPDECELVGNDCDNNGIPDECDPDCDSDGTPDACELVGNDCNSNGTPDNCELAGNDCNSNGVPDDCDTDCNNNGTPDDCESITDCNSNGIPDECELVGNDCNSNGIPDECETDCNSNGTPDDCESFTDCNSNSIPDECELVGNDCNNDSIPDDCQLAGNDCNSNGIPDECETDCNSNGTPDDCESFADCNSNSIPDECEIAGNDCNSNGVPDECDLDCNNNGTPDDCESITDCNSDGVPDECQLVANDCNNTGIPDDCELAGNDCNNNNRPDECDLVNNDCNSNGIPDGCDTDCNNNNIPDDCESFADCNSSGVPDECELAGNDCNSNGVPDECDTDCNTNGIPDDCDTGPDCNSNSVPDECELGGNDCNSNGIPDECDTDCNSNGTPDNCESFSDCNSNSVPDECDLFGNDCNSNSIPDDCEFDCNNNGFPDDCDLTGNDCNSNGTPDDCELLGNDCNNNGSPDECDLVGNDCNSNGVPDDCDYDCNNNGTPDVCEAGPDCNRNGVPDDCETNGNDCNSNGIPDECDSDCNNNGTPDDCEAGADCNSNGTPDDCELLGNDCDNNGVPDECQPDCDSDGTPDDCETLQVDCNSNGVPDDCDPDCNSNGTPDDCESFADCNSNGVPDECDPDCDTDGTPDDCEGEPDCNTNGIPDSCDISSGTSLDVDLNGIPDECQQLGTPYCFGDGSGTPCPCANVGGAGEGCANGSGSGAVLSLSGSSSAGADDLELHGTNLVSAALLFSGTTQINGGNGNPFGDGLRCVGGPVARLGVRIPDINDEATWGPGLAAAEGWGAGDTRTFQIWYRDTQAGSPCGFNFNLTNGVELTYTP